MSVQNKLILRRFFEELFNPGNLAAADEIVSTTYINHNPAPAKPQGVGACPNLLPRCMPPFAI